MELITIIGTDDITEDLYVQIPETIIQQLGWNEGTQINWQIEGESIIIKNTTESQPESKHPFNIIEEEVKHYLESESEGKETYGQTHKIEKDH
jgi:antitoxin component of MazEF toxin-antitoxin module